MILRNIMLTLFLSYICLASFTAQKYAVYTADKKKWDNAQSSCESNFGTSLATITNEQDNQLVLQLANKNGLTTESLWIGATDSSDPDNFTWTDGTGSLDNLYANWQSGGPDGGDCVRFSTSDGLWGDTSCNNNNYYFVCNNPQYVFVNRQMSFTKANEYCINAYNTSLATFGSIDANNNGFNTTLNGISHIINNINVSRDDISSIVDDDSNSTVSVWIGLKFKYPTINTNENCTNVNLGGVLKNYFGINLCNNNTNNYNYSLWMDGSAATWTNWYSYSNHSISKHNSSTDHNSTHFCANLKVKLKNNGSTLSIAKIGSQYHWYITNCSHNNNNNNKHYFLCNGYSENNTLLPTAYPTFNPTIPTIIPTNIPTIHPTNIPSMYPSFIPTLIPSFTPTNPTLMPSIIPTTYPTNIPTINPTNDTNVPSNAPTVSPSISPSITPTNTPTNIPTFTPSTAPSQTPTNTPSNTPSNAPSNIPTDIPSTIPTTAPTNTPSFTPTHTPTNDTNTPSNAPTITPSISPTTVPTYSPTIHPTDIPSTIPTQAPTFSPSTAPTNVPTNTPTNIPSTIPTRVPTNTPSIPPTHTPTDTPSDTPTDSPSNSPTNEPTDPTFNPTRYPTYEPTMQPTPIEEFEVSMTDQTSLVVFLSVLFVSIIVTSIGLYIMTNKQYNNHLFYQLLSCITLFVTILIVLFFWNLNSIVSQIFFFIAFTVWYFFVLLLWLDKDYLNLSLFVYFSNDENWSSCFCNRYDCCRFSNIGQCTVSASLQNISTLNDYFQSDIHVFKGRSRVNNSDDIQPGRDINIKEYVFWYFKDTRVTYSIWRRLHFKIHFINLPLFGAYLGMVSSVFFNSICL